MTLSGRLRSSLIIGGQGIRARKLRTFLSMLSLFLGVLAVVAVQAGSVIAQRALLSDLEMTMGRDGTLQLYPPGDDGASAIVLDAVADRTDAVAMTRARAIVGEPGLRPVNEGGGPIDGGLGYGPQPMGPGGEAMACDAQGNCAPAGQERVVPTGQAIELQLLAVSGDIRQFRPFRLESGRFLDFDSAPSLAPRIVLNKHAAEAFTQFHVPAEMRIEGATANTTPRVIGVVDDGGWSPAAYVRTDELVNWMPVDFLTDPTQGGSVELLAAPSADDLERVLRARLAANGMNPDELHVQTIQALKEMESQLALMRWIFLGMAVLVLLIGVAGILNVGLATVGERVEEFALRRAVGTPRLLLAGIVLAETLLTGLLTAVAAIGAGVVGLEGASRLLASREPFLADVAFPWQAGVAGVIAGVAAGVLGGLVPAIRAARIPIATVMRA
ncbi:ABC transporter permease [Actinophytocola xanthii]|uniref:Permease n=1 Tax=Actinophytocola xanthii TaxID=1912961 RepID=A0A1Q8CGP4_9PSEU|nr:ABC transporter permease [Actinophytocola xanthii]OLF13545.1 permease [Actinophytocola xanthii]